LLMPGGETREVYLPYVSGEKRQIFWNETFVVWRKLEAGAWLVSASTKWFMYLCQQLTVYSCECRYVSTELEMAPKEEILVQFQGQSLNLPGDIAENKENLCQ
jgi:hypothetical protein